MVLIGVVTPLPYFGLHIYLSTLSRVWKRYCMLLAVEYLTRMMFYREICRIIISSPRIYSRWKCHHSWFCKQLEPTLLGDFPRGGRRLDFLPAGALVLLVPLFPSLLRYFHTSLFPFPNGLYRGSRSVSECDLFSRFSSSSTATNSFQKDCLGPEYPSLWSTKWCTF